MDKEAIKRKKALIDEEVRLAKIHIGEAKGQAAIAEQHFENVLNHIRDLEGLLKA